MSERVPALDGVRGLAIILVFLVHTSFPYLPGGRIGVDLFFTLSGYLITTLLLREHRNTGSISIWRFYMRRVLRLYPALVSVVMFVVVYAWLTAPEQLPVTIENAREVMLYYFNWRLVYDLPHHQWNFSHLWSLSVEEQFYIVWPVLTVFLLKRPTRIALSVMVAVIIIDGLARPYLAYRDGSPLWIYFDTIWRADGLMWGALVAWLLHLRKPDPFEAYLLKWASVVGFAGLLFLSTKELLMTGFLYYGGFSLVGLLSAILIAGAVVNPPQWLAAALTFKPMRYVGSISYAAYLWHWPVIRIVAENPVIQIGTTLGIAALSMWLLEAPFLRMKHRFEPTAADRAQSVSG